MINFFYFKRKPQIKSGDVDGQLTLAYLAAQEELQLAAQAFAEACDPLSVDCAIFRQLAAETNLSRLYRLQNNRSSGQQRGAGYVG